MNDRDAAFTAYHAARGATLRGTAFLLCCSWQLAEDLTQATFIKLYRVWGRLSKSDTMDAYVRQVLIRTFLDKRRRPWRREYSVEPHDQVLGAAQPPPDVGLTVDLAPGA